MKGLLKVVTRRAGEGGNGQGEERVQWRLSCAPFISRPKAERKIARKNYRKKTVRERVVNDTWRAVL